MNVLEQINQAGIREALRLLDRESRRRCSAQTVLEALSQAGLEYWVRGPLPTGTSTPSQWEIDPVVVAAGTSEASTLGDPLLPGILLCLTCVTLGASGTRTITYSTGYNSTGKTTIVFNATRQSAFLLSVPDQTSSGSATTYRWQLLTSDEQATFVTTSFVVAAGVATAATTALVNTPGLSVNVAAGKTYRFRAKVLLTVDATSGIKLSMGGTCTATAIGFNTAIFSDTSHNIAAASQETALAGAVSYATDTSLWAEIDGVITVNAAGTLTVTNGLSTGTTAGTVNFGSFLEITQLA